MHFDLRVKLSVARADVEMQVRVHPALAERALYYWASDYAAQLVRGQDYVSLVPTVSVLWLAEPLFAHITRLHSVFELRERDGNTRFSQHPLRRAMRTPAPELGATR